MNINVADVICIVEKVDGNDNNVADVICIVEIVDGNDNNVADVICIVEIVDSSEYQSSRRNLYSRNSGQ